MSKHVSLTPKLFIYQISCPPDKYCGKKCVTELKMGYFGIYMVGQKLKYKIPEVPTNIRYEPLGNYNRPIIIGSISLNRPKTDNC